MNSKVFTFSGNENTLPNNAGYYELILDVPNFNLNGNVYLKTFHLNWWIANNGLRKVYVPDNCDFFDCQGVFTYDLLSSNGGIGDQPAIQTWSGTPNSGQLKFFYPGLYEFPEKGIELTSKTYFQLAWHNWDNVNTWTFQSNIIIYCNIDTPATRYAEGTGSKIYRRGL